MQTSLYNRTFNVDYNPKNPFSLVNAANVDSLLQKHESGNLDPSYLLPLFQYLISSRKLLALSRSYYKYAKKLAELGVVKGFENLFC